MIPPLGMKLNGNEKIVAAIKRRLDVTDGYCPCVADSIGNEDYKCPCLKARKDNECCCRLFEKE